MRQYVFIHVDYIGNCWKHIHFSRLAADRARRKWSKMISVVKACSSKISTQVRNVKRPCIVGMNVESVIELEE